MGLESGNQPDSFFPSVDLARGVIQRNAAGEAVRVVGSHSDVTADTVADPVTGLPNRLLFLEHLTRSIERANRYEGHHFAVLTVDLDRPASAEEPAVLTAEDPLLTAAARRLETSVRAEDPPRPLHNDLVARLQGDQFAVLLDGLKDVSHAKVARPCATPPTSSPNRWTTRGRRSS